MPFSRPGWRFCRRVCLCSVITIVVSIIAVVVSIIFKVALPMRRAHYVELDYQRRLYTQEYALNRTSTPIKPLIEGIDQIFLESFSTYKQNTYDAVLGINPDGTAADFVEGWTAWIYLAGTSPDSKEPLQRQGYSHKWLKPDCDDPAHICESFIDAFDAVAKRQNAESTGLRKHYLERPQTPLFWVDCDISPLMCHPFWGLGGVNVLMHMSVGEECDYSWYSAGSCSVTWRYIGLPIYQPAWTRQIRIPLNDGGSTVVPAFPSAEEQLWNIIMYEDALEVLDYDNETSYPPRWNSMVTVTPQHDGPPKSEDWPIPFEIWGTSLNFIQHPIPTAEFPFEPEVICYAERYLDMFLDWWDRSETIIKPRSCIGVAEERREERERQRVWQEQSELRNAHEQKARIEYERHMAKVFADLELRELEQKMGAGRSDE